MDYEYNKGDIVLLEAVKEVKSYFIGGKLHVKIIKRIDGLYFRPFLLKYTSAIPISVIDYFNPLWMMDDKNRSHLEIEKFITQRGLEYYEVMWTVILNTWKETNFSCKEREEILNCSLLGGWPNETTAIQ